MEYLFFSAVFNISSRFYFRATRILSIDPLREPRVARWFVRKQNREGDP
jgi:hypothetical protein